MKKILEELFSNHDASLASELLRALVNNIRPPALSGNTYSSEKLQLLTALLQQNVNYKEGLQRNILFVIHHSSITELFSESGIINRGSFWSEFYEKISNKILPPVSDERSLNRQLNNVFREQKDADWVERIPDEEWTLFFIALDFKFVSIPFNIKTQMFNALKILSYRVASLGLEREINQKITDDDELLSPYLTQNNEVYNLIILLSTGLSSSEVDSRFKKIIELLKQCEANLELIKERISVAGTSLHQIFIVSRIRQMLVRMRIIIDFMDDANFEVIRFIQFFKKIIRVEKNRNKVSELLFENISLLSYQIAEHKSQSGEHYIANNRKEYLKFFYSACGGGIIISIIVIFKLIIHHAGYAPFWEAIMYSFNYSIGFILIHITGSTLATKQPAMTASTIARLLDIKVSGKLPDENIALLVAKVISTQTISFIGNLIMVFPLTVAWVMLIEYFSGTHFVDIIEAESMLDANNPVRSLVWVYAGVTGFFLFLSGIISGYYDNKVIYDNIPERIKQHPYLFKMVPQKTLNYFANYMNNNLGSLAGNFALGFFLGTAAFIGEILGWHYDIRHITISSGYFSIGVYENYLILPWWEIAIVLLGVIGVGFMNFFISFSLALYVALKSRNVSVSNYGNLFELIIRYFFRHPFDFIIPPANARIASEIRK